MSQNIAKIEAPHPKTLIERFAGRFHVEPSKLMTTLKNTCFKQRGDKEVSNEQMMALIITADQYKLNPFTKELYAFDDGRGGIVPVVSVDGWARIINEHPAMDGLEFVYPEPGADRRHEWIECRIYRKDRAHPTVVREFLHEVLRRTDPWQTMTNRMHRHKALIQCSRIAFGFAGIYDQDEAERIIEGEVRRDHAENMSEEVAAAPTTAKAAEALLDMSDDEPPAIDKEAMADFVAEMEAAEAEKGKK